MPLAVILLVGPSPTPPAATVTNPATWMPAATLTAAVLAALVAAFSAFLQRRSGRESADAARRSAEASERSALAAEAAVAVNERTSVAVSRRAESDALVKRYQDSAELLGHERAAVRRAGVYAMARLADDWPDQRQACVDVLCGYLKMQPIEEMSEHEVRAAITEVLAEHLRRDAGDITWSGLRIDFSNAHLEEIDFSDAVFERRTHFRDATFSRTCLMDRVAFCGGADFEGARVSEGGLLRLEDCDLGPGTVFREVVTEPESSIVIYQGPTGRRVVATELDVRGTVFVLLNPSQSEEYYDLTGTQIDEGGKLRIDFARNTGDLPRGKRASLGGVHVSEGGEVHVPQVLIDLEVVHWGPFADAPPESLSFEPDPHLEEKLRTRIRCIPGDGTE
jgi:hypothetical protein